MKFPLRSCKSIFYFVKMKRIFLKKVLKKEFFFETYYKCLIDSVL
jgi:hypothetical protein